LYQRKKKKNVPILGRFWHRQNNYPRTGHLKNAGNKKKSEAHRVPFWSQFTQGFSEAD